MTDLPRPPALLLAAVLASGCGLSGGRLAIVEENDVFNLGDGLAVDRDYSQGGAAALTMTDADTPEWARGAAKAIPLFADGARVHLALALGQEIYTPEDRTVATPIPDDRPYAGWLYAGLALQGISLDEDSERRRDRVDTLELDLGTTGPASLAEPSQNVAHRAFGIPEAQGWDHQLDGEPGLLLTWERRWRAWRADLGGSCAVEALPKVRVRAGTVRDDAAVGGVLRLGWNLPRDFGPTLVDGTGLVKGEAAPKPWIALHGGAEGRGVLRDLFLDGGAFRDGPSVDRVGFVYDSLAGISGGYGNLAVLYALTWRSPEFRERERYHEFATILVTWTWRF